MVMGDAFIYKHGSARMERGTILICIFSIFIYKQVVWFRMLSKISKCQGLAACAEAYAHRIVVEDEMDQGRCWLKEKGEFWSFMKRAHYQVLM